MKPAERLQIDFIVDCLLEEPQPERKVIWAKFVEKWRKASSRNFDRRFTAAKKEWEKIQGRISAQVELLIQNEIKLRKAKILGQVEKRELLSEIAKGNVEIPDTEVKWNPAEKKFQTIKSIELAGHQSRISAVSELNKMDGDYAPAKNELVITDHKLPITRRVIGGQKALK